MAENNKGGYGKRPMWQWVLIYIVVGGIIYGLIYYFYLGRNGGYNYNNSTTNTTQYGQ